MEEGDDFDLVIQPEFNQMESRKSLMKKSSTVLQDVAETKFESNEDLKSLASGSLNSDKYEEDTLDNNQKFLYLDFGEDE